MTSSTSLPDAWIDRIFGRLTVMFGTEFTGRYAGQDIAAVKVDWARELVGFATWPEAIAYALEHVDRAPTARQFRDLARKAPTRAARALPAPDLRPDPLAVAAAVLEARQAFTRTIPAGKLAVAEHLRDREENHAGRLTSGRQMTQFHRDYWRQVLSGRAILGSDGPDQ